MDTNRIIRAAHKAIVEADDALGVAVDLDKAVKALSRSVAGAKDVEVLKRPLSAEQIQKLAKDGRLTVRVLLDLDELGVARDCLNDAVSEMVTGDSTALEDMSYEPVGVKAGRVIVEVDADVTGWLEGQKSGE
jgi:hypothetical protein